MEIPWRGTPLHKLVKTTGKDVYPPVAVSPQHTVLFKVQYHDNFILIFILVPFSAKHIGQFTSHTARVTGAGCPVGHRGIAAGYVAIAPEQFYEL
ncbi:hypothetical protein J6590_034895 [Homalodisca vitripennis]|nr:hypothetical protein J6590_034895 [Homalodisca vitripennis]